jgi:hemerythrin superfamily protein
MSAPSTLKHPGNALKSAADKSATDILDTLKKEHNEVKELLASLQSAGAADDRRSLVKQIKSALLPHAKAEEKVVYNAVIALKYMDAKTHGSEGYLEHEWAAKTLQRLEAIDDPTSPEHIAASKVLKELVEHHIQEEESSIWDDVEKNFDEEQRRRMNAAFQAAKARVRIH